MARSSDLKLAHHSRLIRELKSIENPPKKILVAVSGGVDSVVLITLLNEVRGVFGFELMVGHVHHGLSDSKETSDYRNRAQKFTESLALHLNLPYKTNIPHAQQLQSEEALRNLRFALLKTWKEELGFDAIALGHHAEDLLETQFMRLMRGSSQLGLGAMSVFSPALRLRPLLNFKKTEILAYAQTAHLDWVEDPSNQTIGPLRNRVRILLDQMEQALPGAKKNFARSLQRVAKLNRALERSWFKEVLTIRGIDRHRFIELPDALKLQALASYLRQEGVTSYTSGQLEEICKRLDRNQKHHTFEFLGCFWDVTLDLISIKDI